ncbi:MAG: hypothetical protein ABSF60_04500 [Verrucomicrobiota bacterium]
MEVVVIIALIAFLAAMLFSAFSNHHPVRAQQISCVNNLKQIGLAFRVWEGDHGDKYPMAVSATNGGAMELVATGNVAACFQVMSNELSTPKILICPEDAAHRVWATNFATGFNDSHISYFVGLVANDSKPQMLLSGDDNFAISGVPAKSGLLELSTNAPIAWNHPRHTSYKSHFWTPANYKSVGYIGFADGSVQEATAHGLRDLLQQTGVATNRLVIP